ncbi:MAG: hypothetical protein JEY94_10070 [Melioribacteraceae bacterium]|nr:hypothetical protein [Melioribacteraceae bacterium]
MTKENKNLKKNLEKIFIESNSSEQIFDAFQLLLYNNLEDMDIIRVFLGNPSLSIDEIVMYSEKLALTFTNQAYEIFLWTGYVFESKFGCADYSLNYYIKASKKSPKEFAPFVSAINLYNFEYPLPANKNIIKMVEEGAACVKKRSKVYSEFAKLHQKLGDRELNLKYTELAERSALTED